MQNPSSGTLTAAVTGATGAIGKAIARGLAQRGCQVFLLCRNKAKGLQAASDIKTKTGNQAVEVKLVNVSRKASIQALTSSWSSPLDILVNNAAVAPPQRQETPEGIECQFATNVLGYFWMTEFFTSILFASKNGRIVNVASYWAGGLDLDDLEFKNRPYRNGEAYRQSKQANRMLTAAFAQRVDPGKIAINACHPGDVRSTLSTDLGFGGSATPAQGAETPLWLALHPIGGQVTGRYFEHKKEVPCPFMRETSRVEELYQICSRY